LRPNATPGTLGNHAADGYDHIMLDEHLNLHHDNFMMLARAIDEQGVDKQETPPIAFRSDLRGLSYCDR
jgi:hypothetical protein